MRRFWHHTDFLVGKVRRTLIAFSDNCRVLNFAMGNLKTISICFPYCFIKIYCLLCTLNGSFDHICFKKKYHLEKYWFTPKFPNGTLGHYTIFHLSVMPSISSEKFSRIGKLSSSQEQLTHFPKL